MILEKLFSFFNNISVDGYVSIICAFITLMGTYITVKFAKSQVKEDKRISIKPYFKIWLEGVCSFNKIEREDVKFYMEDLNRFSFSRIEVLGDSSIINVALLSLDFSNIGLEKAIDFKISNIYEKIKKVFKRSLKFNKEFLKYYTPVIGKDEKEHFNLNFIYSIDKHKLKTIRKMEYEEFKEIFDSCVENPKKMYIDFTYRDLLNNKYRIRYGIQFRLYPIYDKQKKELVEYRPHITEIEGNYKEKLIKDNIFNIIMRK